MKNQLKTVVLLGALSALVIGFGSLVAPGSLYLFAALALAMNLGAYFFSDRLVLRMNGARELAEAEAPWLYREVRELARRADIPVPRLFVIPDPQPNAFATGRNPEHGVVAVTQGIVELLDRRELRGVLAHEIAHIKNRDILVATIAAAFSSLITTAAQALSFATLFGGQSEDDAEGGAGTSWLALLVAPLAASLIQMGISRSREYLADETAGRLTGEPQALAQALLKLEHGSQLIQAGVAPATASLFIVNPLFGSGGVAQWFSTHPATEERVRRLMAQKPEPSKPSSVRYAA